MVIFDLTKDTFLLYAIQHYENPGCKGMKEFSEDLKKFKYIKRLLTNYKMGKGLRERLILNHIIVLSNIFGNEAAVKMLFYKIGNEFWSELKTFLIFLNLMPENVMIYGVHDSAIPINIEIANELRKI